MADLDNLSEAELERSVLRKVLTRLIPFLALLYAFCIIDRSNVSIASLAMMKDLHYTDAIYGMGAGLFFIGYFLFEVPSNLILERVGARRWIARIMFTWGAVSASFMFVRTPTSFYALRFLLGLAEAGFYPGIILYLTYWVPGTVRARVLSRFLALQAFFAMGSGPLGAVLLKMNGVAGLHGWQWLFLMEGIPSALLGFAVFKALPDSPKEAQWLSTSEREWITRSLAIDAKREQQVHHLTIRSAFTEPRILLLCLIFFLTATGGNAVGFSAPQLIKARSLGLWSNSYVSFLMIIPAIVGAVAMSVAASHSDRTGLRKYHVSIGYLIAGIAFFACAHAPSAWLVIGALTVNALGERIAAGSYWAVTSNMLGARAAAGGIAMINSVGNLGGFAGPFLMGQLKTRAHGDFTPGLYVAGMLVVVGAVASLYLRNPPPDGATQAEIYENEMSDGVAAAASVLE